MKQTLESLLATVLGDLETLGDGVLLRDDAAAELNARDARRWAEIVAVRYPDVVHPWLQYDIRRALEASDGRGVLGVLRYAVDQCGGSGMALGMSRFPLAVFCPDSFSQRPCLGMRIADAHLHSGASMPLALFLRGLATCRSPVVRSEETEALVSITASGRSWDGVGLLAAARWALRLLWYLHQGGTLDNGRTLASHGLDADLVAAVQDGSFWETVGRALCVDRPERDAMLVSINPFFAHDDGQCPPIHKIFWFWHDRQPIGARASASYLVGLVRVIATISSILTSRPGEGLSRFVDRFQLMGKAKDAAFDESHFEKLRVDLMEQTVAAIAPTDDVVGAEFRKTVTTSDAASFEAQVRAALKTHHEAFARHASKRQMALTMPVGFRRQASPTLNPAAAGVGELRHVLAGCQALASIHRGLGGEDLIEGIWSIDVADEEVGSTNWPYQLGAELLRAAGVPLVFTLHAGESFVSSLNGVRRVGELFLGAEPPKRIGHALALSEQATKMVLKRGHPPIIRAEAIMDLAWLARLGIASAEAHSLLHKLVEPLYPHTMIGVADWVLAFDALHRLEQVDRMLLFEVGGGSREVAGEDELMARARCGGPVDRAIAALAWSAPPEIAGCDVSEALSGDLLEAYRVLSHATAGEARRLVLDLLSEQDVTIEACPTSNVTLAKLAGYDAHPLWEWMPRIPVSVSSDDPLLFGSTVIDEFQALLDSGGDARIIAEIADVSVRGCSGGDPRRIAGWTAYQRVADVAVRGSAA